MTEFSKTISIRWSDIDANFHLRHSAYYDFASQIRIEVLQHFGITMSLMQKENFAPVILREEAVFKREIKHEDIITVKVAISKLTSNASKYTIIHEFINTDNKLCATVTIEGAWIDTKLRKLKILSPAIIETLLNKFPKTKNFEIV